MRLFLTVAQATTRPCLEEEYNTPDMLERIQLTITTIHRTIIL
jgi:hypothetical protein